MRWILVLLAILLLFSPLTAQEFNPDNGHYYQYVHCIPNYITWNEAKDSAEQLGGYLATITSQTEQDFITPLISPEAGYTHIGGADSATEGVWEWITGEIFGYTNWKSGEPNSHYGATEDFLMMFPDGEWNDGPDYSETGFVVEWDCNPNTLHHVPADFPTIQQAINVACDGDTVLVSDGHYYERISFLGKSIVVASEYIFDPDTNHILNTIIDADTSVIGYSDSGSVIIIGNSVDTAEVIGLSLLNGTGTFAECSYNSDTYYYGGGIFLNQANVIIRHCIINECSAEHGNGFACLESSVVIDSCEFYNEIMGRMSSSVNVTNSYIKGVKDELTYYAIYSILACSLDYVSAEKAEITIDSSRTGYISARNSSTINVYNSSTGNGSAIWMNTNLSYENCNTEFLSTTQDAYITATNSIVGGFGDGYIGLRNCDVLGNCTPGFLMQSAKDCRFFGMLDIMAGANFTNDSCLFFGNIELYDSTGVGWDGSCAFNNATFFNNTINYFLEAPRVSFNNCSFSNEIEPIFNFTGSSDSLILYCCNVYNPVDNSWYSDIPEFLDTTNLYFTHPRFCNPDDSDYTLATNSFCLPENNPCSLLIGAKTMGCDSISVILHVATDGSDFTGDGSALNPYATIQYAIEQASNDDTVVVHDGIYYERISYLGKSIVVASEFILDFDSSHIDNTIIDGTDVPPIADSSSLIRFVNNETEQSQINGLTLQNSSQGILCSDASPSVSNCNILNHSIGVQTEVSSSPTISDCLISGNGTGVFSNAFTSLSINKSDLTENSLAVRIRYSSANITGSNIVDNGQALSLYNPSTASFESCIIKNNSLHASPSGKDLEKEARGRLTITNSVIRNSDVEFGYSGLTLINDSVWNSDISLLFLDSNGDFHNSYFNQCHVSAFESSFSMDSCFIIGGISTGSTNAGALHIYNTTLLTDGLTLLHGYMYFNHSILISTSGEPIITGPDTISTFTGLNIQCSDIYGCTDDEWIALYPSQKIDTSFVYFANPIFCDTASGDYSIADISVCAPANNDCGELIGVYEVGCNVGVPVFAAMTDTTITEMLSLEFEVTATCDDGTTPVLSATGLPENAIFMDKDDGTGEFSWQTDNFDTGVYDISLFAHHPDYSTLYDSQSLIITVLDSNLVPIFSAMPPDQNNEVQEGDTLIYTFSAFDPDSTIPVMVIDSAFVPDSISYLLDFVTFTDSGNGNGVLEFYPDYTMAELPPDLPGHYYLRWKVIDAFDYALYVFSPPYEFIVHGTDPHILDIFIDGQNPALNVVDHTPLIEWSYTDPLEAKAQSQFEIAVGTDDDWTYAEMWNPAPFESSDTSVVYNGSPLIDGEIYYARLRVNNGFAWSEWFETTFRMNTPPTIPVMLSPIDSAVVASTQPYLWILNSLDAEGDDLFYDFRCYVDSIPQNDTTIPQMPDSTALIVDPPLMENGAYSWLARAHDGYEYSDWTTGEIFFVNAIEEFPGSFTITAPPDTGWPQVYSFPTKFTWLEPFEPDPLDSVYYQLLLSHDENFTFVATYDSIFNNADTINLDYSTHYWWKVLAIDTKGNITESDNVADFLTWVLGDVNADASTNVGDAVYLIGHIFNGGPAPIPIKIGDTNGDCSVNIGDAVYLINYIFNSGSSAIAGCTE